MPCPNPNININVVICLCLCLCFVFVLMKPRSTFASWSQHTPHDIWHMAYMLVTLYSSPNSLWKEPKHQDSGSYKSGIRNQNKDKDKDITSPLTLIFRRSFPGSTSFLMHVLVLILTHVYQVQVYWKHRMLMLVLFRFKIRVRVRESGVGIQNINSQLKSRALGVGSRFTSKGVPGTQPKNMNATGN